MIRSLYREVDDERVRAHEKFKDSTAGSREEAHWLDGSWRYVLGEEIGEVDKAFNEYRLTNISYNEFRSQVRKELIQVAAMASAWAAAIDRDNDDGS